MLRRNRQSSQKSAAKRSRRAGARRNRTNRRLTGFQPLEERRLLTCVAGGADNNDQTCEARLMDVGETTGIFNIDPNDDVDMFQVTLAEGQFVGFDVDNTAGSSLDSYLRLFDATGTQITFSDDSVGPAPENSSLESYLEFLAPTSGDYFVGISSFQNQTYDAMDGTGDSAGSSTGGFTLEVLDLDDDDQIGEATPISVGASSGIFTINSTRDVDLFEIDVTGGDTIGFDIDNLAGGQLDAEIRLFNSSGIEIARDDDTNGPAPEVSDLESYLEFEFPSSGTFYLGVTHYTNDSYDINTGVGDDGSLNSANIGSFVLSVNRVEETPSLNVTIATDTVDSSDNETSLREAIDFANSNPGTDTITFDAGLTAVNVTGDEIAINESLTIDGPGVDQLTINGNASSRLFNTNLSAGDSFTVEDITISGAGNSSVDGGAILHNDSSTLNVVRSRLTGNTAQDGGAIYSFGTVVVRESEISGNSATVDGGGIFMFEGDLTVTNSTMSGNAAQDDAGGVYAGRSPTTITNSTFSGNTAVSDGGAIFAATHNNTLTINNSTIVDNIATDRAGGVRTDASDPNIINNTIIANNSSGNGRDDIDGPVTANFSLIGNSTTGATISGGNNLLDVDPQLGPLADNGGPTLTHAILAGSPAISAGDPAAMAGVGDTPQFDQRGSGNSRVKQGRLDIGAFESDFVAETPSLHVTIATDTVDNTDNETSLREAIDFANSNPDASTITFDAGLTEVNVSGGQIDINESLTIDGLGADQLTINGNASSRLFNTNLSAGDSFTIEDITISGAGVNSQNGGAIHHNDNSTLNVVRSRLTGNTAHRGGAILSYGTVIVRESEISDNSAALDGGGLFVRYGDLSLTDSTISGNSTSRDGGGVYVGRLSTTTNSITNSTVSGNTAGDDGGAIFAFFHYNRLTINNSTIVDNMSTDRGGGVLTDPSDPTIINNTIVANNSSGNGRDDIDGPVTANFSLIGNSTTGAIISGGNNLLDVDPQLGPLADNGGPTLTHLPQQGSLAINGGDPGFTNPPGTDQTGATRVRGGRLDIGSVEVQGDAPTFTSSTTATAAENQTLAQSLSATGGNTFSLTGGGADASQFQIVSGNQLRFLTAPDFENPTDVGGNNVYEVEIQVASNLGIPATQTVAVTVTDVNDLAPVFTSDSFVGILENSTVVQTLTANAGGPVSFSIVGGADQSRFNLSGSDQLRFNTAPDFENPTDAGGDNIYNVTVRATSGGLTTDQNVTVEVFGENEFTPVITSSPNASLPENTTFVTTVTATDGDAGGDGEVIYMIAPGLDANLFDLDAFSGELRFQTAPDFENPNSVSGTNTYQVNLQVEDQGSRDTFQLLTINVNPVNDNAPVFTTGNQPTVDENTTFVQTVAATDADSPGDNVTFSITSAPDSSRFSLVNGNQLVFNSAPDFENPQDQDGDNIYVVDVTADDNAGLTTTQRHFVSVNNLTENSLLCDFDGDMDCDGADINMLQANIVSGPADPGTFDLTADGQVNVADRDEWLVLAGAENLASGNAYLPGDANLDGVVDASDFNVWNGSKFTSTSNWTSGDFNADGVVDASDFNVWNANKFTSADSLSRSIDGGDEGKKERRESGVLSVLDRVFAELE